MARRTNARVTIAQAKAQLSRLIERAGRGEVVVIYRGDVPVVRLVPVSRPVVQRRFGAMKGLIRVPDSFFDPLPDDELG
jgi:prevent-host-death family protein